MNDIVSRFLFDLFILLFHSHIISSSSSIVLYPSFEHIVDQLISNSTLPQCTLTTCQQTQTQANFSHIKISDEYLLKLSLYDKFNRKNTSFSGPYLISSTGIYRGKRMKYSNRYIDQFLGIYYAEIPQVLQKPVKKRFNSSLQNATKFSPCCRQSLLMAENLSYGSFVMQHHFDDNCLSLNIYRADLRYGEKRKAIMLFSHGGSNQLGKKINDAWVLGKLKEIPFSLGGGSLFDGSILASEGDMIVITMNFRLNYHGFLSSGDDRVKGNYGLWDQLLAVEWIYENAHLFGGDPNRIVLTGHSAGAGNVMLIPASPYCRGMIRRVISQSGTGLAPWSINRNPLKLLQRFSQDFDCDHSNEKDMIDCIYNLLEKSNGDIYRLHLSLSIADDNPYPVIDNDFINDTMENILQSDAYNNIDFLTGVTLNEGLYFAEYHIKHLFNDLQNQSESRNKSSSREKRSIVYPNSSAIIPPDITFTEDYDTKEIPQENIANEKQRKAKSESPSNPDPNILLEHFVKLNYVQRYIEANFQHEKCFIDEIKKRYEPTAENNIINRLKLYIDLVSDLMFNFHMVRCLDLRTKVSNSNASNYAYIYSHRPTFKVRSTFRDQLKLLPQAIGHFAELDYVFGVPLARNYSRIHRNVNMSYYNYSSAEEDFSRQVIRYWANFIKTGNPNKDFSPVNPIQTEWKLYTETEHNYLYFQLNHIHNERDYFDSMYHFWLECFRIENTGGCDRIPMKKHFTTLLILFIFIFLSLMICFLWKYFQKKQKGHLLSNRSPTALLPYPNHLST